MAGNANSGNRTGLPRSREDRPFFHALRREMAKASISDDDTAYHQLARKLMKAASNGEAWAIKELIDRLDGKSIQQIESHNINENHFVKAPEKASKDDWQKYLEHKAKPAAAAAGSGKSNGSSNGKSH